MEKVELQARILRGEDETLELKTSVPTPDVIANQLASFSNAKGGLLVIGVKEPSQIIGVNVERAKSSIEAAQRYLSPRISVDVEVHSIDGKDIVVANVPEASHLIATRGSYYRRVGTHTRPLTADEIVGHAREKGANDAVIKELSAVISTQTAAIEKLRDEFNKANSTPLKIAIAVGGALIGIIGKYIVDNYL
jgi:ATP-dependent DNA helicase RecG